MSDNTPAITLTGELAAWVVARAKRNTRTPEQELTHILSPFRARELKAQERKRQRAAYWGAGFGGLTLPSAH